MKTSEELKKIKQLINDNKIEKAKANWNGAGVHIDNEPKSVKSDSFYPSPRFVITEFSLEISWLFERLRDAFYAEELLNSCSKEEFFGRLANTANKKLENNNILSKQELCNSIFEEAEKIYSEIISGQFKYMPIASGNEIADDYKSEK